MSFLYDERASTSPYIEAISRVQTDQSGASICRANGRWEMVAKRQGKHQSLIYAGPVTKAILAPYTEDTEYVVVKFKQGAFIPYLPIRDFLDVEVTLPEGVHNSFWLNGDTWELFNYDNVETFIDHLVRNEVLMWDTLVAGALQERAYKAPPDASFRTVRRRFLHATGMAQGTIRQIERAAEAAALLERGVSILDTVDQAGYADQPHLTRALKRFIGQTPAQLARLNQAG